MNKTLTNYTFQGYNFLEWCSLTERNFKISFFILSQKNLENQRSQKYGLRLRELFSTEIYSDGSTFVGRGRTIFDTTVFISVLSVRSATFIGSASFVTFVIRIGETADCTCGVAYINMADIDKTFELLFTRWSCDWSKSKASVCHTVEGALVIWTLKNFEINWIQVAVAHASLFIFISRVPNLEKFFGIFKIDNFAVSWNENQIFEWYSAIEGNYKLKLVFLESTWLKKYVSLFWPIITRHDYTS